MNLNTNTVKNFDVIRDYVLILGNLEPSEGLDLKIATLIDEILAYCYRVDVPKEMERPIAQAIVDEMRIRDISFGGDINSYREGDMSISFGSVSGVKFGGKLEGFKLIIGVKDVQN